VRQPVFFAGDARFLAMIAGVATALLIACLLIHLWRLLMKHALAGAAILACALILSACGTVTGGTSNAQLSDTLKAIASDPRCGHTDRVQGDLGGLGSGLHVFLERTCPAAVAAPGAPAP